MKRPLRVLIIEDSEFDARVVVNVLRGGEFDPVWKRVETAEAMRAALAEQPWDVILADYNLPEFSAPAALKLAQELEVDKPFIIISGGIGEDIAVECMRAGAHDYLMKGSLARLLPAVDRELREAENRAARRQAEQSLRDSELRYRLLWEACPDAVILMDEAGVIHFVNPAVEAVFGYQPTELLGRNLSLLQPEALREPHHHSIANYMATGVKKTSWVARETFGLHKNGRQIIIEISASDMVLNGQRRFVGFIRDITQRKQAEQALQASREQLRLAREIQQRLFPSRPPEIPGFEIAGASYPAAEAGGDYFDYLTMLKGRFGVVVGDVSGHGIGPALLMAETRAYLRLLSIRREDVSEILSIANTALAEDVGPGRYVTLFLARIEPQTRQMIFGSAGHPPCFLYNAQGEIKLAMKRTGMPLGMRSQTTYPPAPPVQLESGDLLVLLTDGVDEALSTREEFFGTARIHDYIRAHREQSAREIVEGLYHTVCQFAEGTEQADDLTAIVVKVK
ncbi:MAG: SpoIIE family protein phosphatase [Verrucomicrobiota bacterium]